MIVSSALRHLTRPTTTAVVNSSGYCRTSLLAAFAVGTNSPFQYRDKSSESTAKSMHKKALNVLLNHTNGTLSHIAPTRDTALGTKPAKVDESEAKSSEVDMLTNQSESVKDSKEQPSWWSPSTNDDNHRASKPSQPKIEIERSQEEGESAATRPLSPPQHLLHEFAPKIVVVGVGGAGGNALNNMIAKELTGVDFLALNTDAQHLSSTLTDKRLQLGVELTQGLGCGANPDAGRLAAEESREQIEETLSDAHLVFITAGMGGGTGTGGKYQSEKLDLQFASRDEVLCCRLTWKAGCRFQFRITRVARSKLVPHCKARFRH